MPTIGTFGSFGIARLGIYAASANLNVTGNNIANINTTGYCRQTVDLTALSTGGADQFASGGNLYFGSGVATDSISQYRDPYMDIRYRDEATVAGQLETYLSGLGDLAFVLDEVAKGDADFGVIEAQISEMLQQLQILSEKSGSEEYDTLVRSTANTLCQLFNSYADKLNSVADNQLEFYDGEIDAVNTLLTNIRDMNEQIRNAGIYGDKALTLRDQRNLLIDELSEKIGIDVYYSDEDLGNGLIVQNLTIKIADTDTELVNGVYCTQLSMDETINMPNTVDEDGLILFDKNESSNYMYLDSNGNPTNDLKLAGVSLNPNYPDVAGRWLGPDGIPVNTIFEAGPAINPEYVDRTGSETNEDGLDYVFTTVLSTTSDGVVYTVEIPLSNPLVNTGDFDTVTNDPIYTGTDPSFGGDWEYWGGGQYAIGVWDETTGDWQKNSDGSYFIATTTNDPYYATVTADGSTYSLIQLNNDVRDGNAYENDNCYMLTLSGLQDKKGYYITDDYGRPISGSILLDDTGYSGALQACRELLTEEGEFSSKVDIAMDADATVKRGIPYYQMSLDALAQQFAAMFNTANELSPQDIFAVNGNDEFYNGNSLVLNDDGTIALDSKGNPIYNVIVGYDSFGEAVNISTSNMYDDAYNEDGDYQGMSNYEYYIYNGGVTAASTINGTADTTGARDYNWKTDSEGRYLQLGTTDSGEVAYVPIILSGPGEEVVYLSPATLTPANLATYENVMLSETEYLPGNMFETNENGQFVNSLGQVLTLNDAANTPITPELAENSLEAFEILQDSGVYTDAYSYLAKDGPLFSNSSSTNDTTGITAGNISISRDWSIGETRIILAKGENPGSSDNSNVLYMITMMDTDLQYDARNVAADAWTGKNEFFKGSFQEMLTNTVSTLAQDMNTTSILLDNSYVSKLSLNNARQSVSGVDLNEEAANMMQYQKAYVAASKLMTTLDEVLEVLLNM